MPHSARANVHSLKITVQQFGVSMLTDCLRGDE